jgi:hypothetical protein
VLQDVDFGNTTIYIRVIGMQSQRLFDFFLASRLCNLAMSSFCFLLQAKRRWERKVGELPKPLLVIETPLLHQPATFNGWLKAAAGSCNSLARQLLPAGLASYVNYLFLITLR